jgi:arsenate reductase
MMTLYGIKNCDSVKKARIWLDKHAVAYRFHDFRVDGLSAELLESWLGRSDWQKLLNRRSSSWHELNDLQKSSIDQASATQLMLEIPTLIKRPVLDTGTNLLIGFDPQQYQTVL